MGFWEKILPGYKGYKEREESRNTDKILREYLTAKLKESRARYEDFKGALTDRGNLDLFKPAEKVTQVMGRVINRLRYANYGFSGRWFGQKIGIDELEKVHEFDKQMATRVQEMQEVVKGLEGLDEDDAITSSLKSLADKLREMDEALNEREQILRTFGGEPEK
ncbi:MAG: hypothetical protein JXR96_15275 [Deltaproteobacteria bacterium]|nr:hypothetical protein [Deltaproteobacteria bacterium]